MEDEPSTSPTDVMFNLKSEVRSILAGTIGGGRYGVKIRLPHALLMTMLFKREATLKQKIRMILRLTANHSGSLAAFATVYKLILLILKRVSVGLHNNKNEYNKLGYLVASILVDGPTSSRRLVQRSPGLPERPQHAAIAGAVGGYLIWGRYNSLNYQVLLYLTSRVIVGLASLAREKGIPPFGWDMMKFPNVYPLKAAAVWATVMVMFETYPHVLHPSLKHSMDEIYRYLPESWNVEAIENSRC